ncbi:hypothetical protein C8A01DRAFT_17817 [Parachaetomium inaequale]|uniref:Uncharacterized protein n=1 Tax=Parachaetomium inaequale TaxID=2588326 RepID=A0AAN6SQ09_9PEZI|nr:hypothetical protein C8A01DRAFT_17817 [Parachaetomium inaequale]
MDQHNHAEDEQSFTGEWQTSLVRWSPCGTLWKALCCPCVIYRETAQRLRDPTVPAEKRGSDCVEFGRDFCIGTYAISLKDHRAQIRRRYRIRGSSNNDCLVACCCYACAVMQHDDELKARLAAEGVVVRDGYKAEGPMVMRAQGQGQGQGQMQMPGGQGQGYENGAGASQGPRV